LKRNGGPNGRSRGNWGGCGMDPGGEEEVAVRRGGGGGGGGQLRGGEGVLPVVAGVWWVSKGVKERGLYVFVYKHCWGGGGGGGGGAGGSMYWQRGGGVVGGGL